MGFFFCWDGNGRSSGHGSCRRNRSDQGLRCGELAAIRARISSTRQAVMRAPSFTGLGKRPSLTPVHHVDLLTGIGPSGARIWGRRTKPLCGSCGAVSEHEEPLADGFFALTRWVGESRQKYDGKGLTFLFVLTTTGGSGSGVD